MLYGIILIKDHKWKKIDVYYLYLVDDLSKFNEFPWSVVTYEFLVRATHHARDVLENMLAERKTLAFDANGFTIALHIWVYEVMPNIARECAKIVPGLIDHILRMIRWCQLNLLSQKSYVLDDLGLHWGTKGFKHIDSELHLHKKTHYLRCECSEMISALNGEVLEPSLIHRLSTLWSKEHQTSILVENLLTRVTSFESSLHELRASSNGIVDCSVSPTRMPPLGVA